MRRFRSRIMLKEKPLGRVFGVGAHTWILGGDGKSRVFILLLKKRKRQVLDKELVMWAVS